MSRVIRIETCAKCPSRDHKGAFAEVYCVPVCNAVSPSRELPHEVKPGFGTRLVAAPTYAIPDWCPLEKLT